MTLDRGVRIALDIGAATASAALIGPVDGRRRLLGSVVLPAGVDEDRLVDHLVERVRAADPNGAERLGLDRAAVADAPRLVVRSSPPPTLAVLATTVRERLVVERVAGLAGWRTRGASHDADGPIGLTRTALGHGVRAILVSGEPATSREETATLAELAAVVGGISRRSTAAPLVLAGEMARDDLPYGPLTAGVDGPIYAPGPGSGEPPGEPLRHLLDRLDPDPGTPRRAALAALVDLAVVLDRRIELIEVGYDGGVRAIAGREGLEAAPAIVPSAGFIQDDLDDETVDAILAWSTVALDRHRMRDRLRELRLSPWVEAYGDGARLRLAVMRAAVARLVAATPWLGALPAPDLVVVAGGGWAAAPGPAIALSVADVVRRPGASQLAFDHARLLGPLGGVADPAERRALLAELADDLLAPLGSVVVPNGLRAGRSAGRLTVRGAAGQTELDLVPGGLQLVDLPPGQVAVADLRFRDPVGLGPRGRHLRVEVGGGLGGLLVDLRDIPLRLPDRAERRRAMLEAWQAAFWTGGDT
ncbi:MAG: hypothetical protein ABI628_01940 [Chloroflexota bacterium]